MEKKNEQSRRGMVISGFPGIGKSTCVQMFPDIRFRDCNSALFGWADEERTIRHPNWPENYLRYVLDGLSDADVHFVSSHREVREGLVCRGVPFICVYPERTSKSEYIERYRQRGESTSYIERIEKVYDDWIADMEAQRGCVLVRLAPGEYLSDILPTLLRDPESSQLGNSR
jgi:hypothetical protein